MENNNNFQNRNIITSIYKKYQDEVKHYFMSYTHNMMAAEDMLQNLFIKVMELDVIAEDTAKNLLMVMAHRMIIDDARHRAFVHNAEKQLSQSISQYDSFSVVRKVETDEIIEMESRQLATMAPKRARVYEMYRHEELSAHEIAEQLNLSQRTVEAHIYLSTKEMKHYLKNII